MYILKWSILSFRHFPLFQKKVYILECPSWRHSSIPWGKVHILFHFLSFSFIFFHFLSFSFIFFHFLLFSFIFFHFLSFSFSFFQFLSVSFSFNFLGRLGRYSIGPSFFSLVYFFIFFIFVFFFNFFTCFPLLFLGFSFFIFLLFSFCFSLSLFSGAQNLWRHSRISLGKVHILSWLDLLCIGSSSLFHVE